MRFQLLPLIPWLRLEIVQQHEHYGGQQQFGKYM
jgi:hypothetical protein